MKKRFLILLLIVILLSCVAGRVDLKITPEVEALSETSSRLHVEKNESAGLYGDVILIVDGNDYVLYLPGSADASKLCFSWESGNTVKDSSGNTMTSGKAPVAAPGKSVTYEVNGGDRTIRTVQGSKNVKAMFLEVDTKISGFYSFSTMNSSSDKSKAAAGMMTYGETDGYYFSIKGRGNSTWTSNPSKKPYNITLYKDANYDNKKGFELIPGVKSKQWSLLANHADVSMMRNKLGYDMALQMGIGLDSTFVDLYADGEYLGTYLMTPKNDYESPKGGYMLEIDNYIDSEDYQFTLDGMGEYHSSWYGYQNRISVKDNESMTPNAEIEAYMQKAWKAMLDTSSEDYLNYIDLDSWAKFYILHEFYKSFDVVCGSILMHRDGTSASDKLIAGPMWDLDNTMGRTNNNADLGLTKAQQHTPEGWYIPSVSDPEGRVKTFWLQQLGKHESFMARVYEIYHQYSSVFNGAAGKVDTFSAQIKASAEMNFDLHSIGNNSHKVTARDTHGCLPNSDWASYIYNLKVYASKRAEFLKNNVPAVLTGDLTVTGKAEAGTTLTANVSGANATDLVYTWKCGTRTATGKTLTLRSGEYGKVITCTVTSPSVQGSLTLTLNPVTVTFQYDGGTGTPASVKLYSNLPYGQLPQPVKAGHEFDGWYTGPKGTGEKITAQTKVTKTTAHLLYANWKAVAVTPEPTDPTVPAGPTEPVTPTDPAAPTDPTVPTDPVVPTDPAVPTAPATPTDPVVPTDPVTPTEPAPTTPVVTDPTEMPTVPPTTGSGSGETMAPTISQIPGTATKPSQPGATPGVPEPAMQLWYILVPAAAILLLAVLFLVKKRKK